MAKRPSRKAAKTPERPRLIGAALGPLAYLPWSWGWALFLLALCGVLTVLTQVGGLLLWVSLPFLASAAGRLRPWSRIAAGIEAATIFLLLYALACLFVVPPLAAMGGRVPLPCFGDTLRSRSVLYCALNRHYVRRDLRALVEDMADAVTRTHPGAKVRTLDAGFPFLDGFPLLPHLSHRNGTAVDLALFYVGRDGWPAPSPSPLGYQIRVRTSGEATLDDGTIHDVLRWLQDAEVARRDDHIHVQIRQTRITPASHPSSD